MLYLYYKYFVNLLTGSFLFLSCCQCPFSSEVMIVKETCQDPRPMLKQVEGSRFGPPKLLRPMNSLIKQPHPNHKIPEGPKTPPMPKQHSKPTNGQRQTSKALLSSSGTFMKASTFLRNRLGNPRHSNVACCRTWDHWHCKVCSAQPSASECEATGIDVRRWD